MSISASLVKELRERTGAGMMECKKALETAQGDLDEAMLVLQKSGQAKAAKRAGQIATEGVIAIQTDKEDKTGFIAEINCETDFVARSDAFRSFVQNICQQGLATKANDVQTLESSFLPDDGQKTIEKARQELIAKLGENIQIRRVAYSTSSGIIGSYNHGNRIGVLVALDQPNADLAHDIAMHIAASNPQAIDSTQLPPATLAREREIFIAQAQESGKPKEIIEKMVDGRITKFIKEICLVDQPFVKDPDKTIKQLLEAHKAKVVAFIRYEVGEGFEKTTKDFSEEVKAQLGERSL